MHQLSASIRFESEQAWQNFSHDDDEKAIENMFSAKGVKLEKPISSSSHYPPIHEMMIEAPDDMDAEDLQSMKYPSGVLVHIEED